MSNEMTNTVVPKLRFPEFEGAGDWEEKKLGELTYPISERNKADKKLPIYSISNVNGFVPQSSQFEGVDSHKRGYNVSLYKVVGGNTFAYNPARINIGSIGYSGELNEVLISSLYVCFQTNDKLNDTFLLYFLKSAAFNQAVNDTVEGGIRSYLFYDNLAIIKIQVPSLLEQQKIAAALSSLDDLITVQSAKLVALQAHKRGLMQGLFPAEGETVPKLRFPEFQEAAEWEEKKLGEVAIFSKGKGISKADIVPNGALPCIRYGELYTRYGEAIDSIISRTNLSPDDLILSQANDVIIPASGETQEDIATASCVMLSGVALGGDLNIIRTKMDGVFLALYLNTAKKQEIAQLAQGISVVHLYSNQLKTLVMFIPSLEEQRKTASCISSLDNRITAQIQKIEALKLHKKGLMQNLFPAAAEPTA